MLGSEFLQNSTQEGGHEAMGGFRGDLNTDQICLSAIFGMFTCRKAFGDHYLARRLRGFLATFSPV